MVSVWVDSLITSLGITSTGTEVSSRLRGVREPTIVITSPRWSSASRKSSAAGPVPTTTVCSSGEYPCISTRTTCDPEGTGSVYSPLSSVNTTAPSSGMETVAPGWGVRVSSAVTVPCSVVVGAVVVGAAVTCVGGAAGGAGSWAATGFAAHSRLTITAPTIRDATVTGFILIGSILIDSASLVRRPYHRDALALTGRNNLRQCDLRDPALDVMVP